MNRFAVIFFFILSIVFPCAVSCEVVDRVIAIVNDDIITLKELERYVPVEKQGRFVSVNEYFRNIKLKEKLDVVIDSLLIKQQAKKMKIDVTDKEVDGIVSGIKKQYLVTDEELREQLKKEHIEYSDFVEGLKSTALRNRVLAQAISPEVLTTESMLQEYYNNHIDEYREEEYKLRQIFISGKSNDPNEPQRKVLQAYGQLREGRPFESVAKEFSEDPSAADGGDIGMVKSEELMPELRQAVRALAPGGYTGILKTPYGLLILNLVETKKGDTLPFELVKDAVRDRIIQEESEKKYKEFVEKLRKSSYIEIKI